MKLKVSSIILIGITVILTACAGGGVGVGVYHHHNYDRWWGARDYYRDRIIVVPPETIEPEYEATPLPSGSEHIPDIDMPDMGMPDIDVGDF